MSARSNPKTIRINDVDFNVMEMLSTRYALQCDECGKDIVSIDPKFIETDQVLSRYVRYVHNWMQPADGEPIECPFCNKSYFYQLEELWKQLRKHVYGKHNRDWDE